MVQVCQVFTYTAEERVGTARSCLNSFPGEDKWHTMFEIKLLMLFKSLDLDHRKTKVRHLMT